MDRIIQTIEAEQILPDPNTNLDDIRLQLLKQEETGAEEGIETKAGKVVEGETAKEDTNGTDTSPGSSQFREVVETPPGHLALKQATSLLKQAINEQFKPGKSESSYRTQLTTEGAQTASEKVQPSSEVTPGKRREPQSSWSDSRPPDQNLAIPQVSSSRGDISLSVPLWKLRSSSRESSSEGLPASSTNSRGVEGTDLEKLREEFDNKLKFIAYLVSTFGNDSIPQETLIKLASAFLSNIDREAELGKIQRTLDNIQTLLSTTQHMHHAPTNGERLVQANERSNEEGDDRPWYQDPQWWAKNTIIIQWTGIVALALAIWAVYAETHGNVSTSPPN
jgi:hypothetical protein